VSAAADLPSYRYFSISHFNDCEALAEDFLFIFVVAVVGISGLVGLLFLIDFVVVCCMYKVREHFQVSIE
jgi:hypothetical protein